MNKLPDSIKHLIVLELACFSTPSEVEQLIWQRHGVEVSRQAIECYNPTRSAGRDLSDKWRTIFSAARANFFRQAADIGVSHKAVRLRALQECLDRATEADNIPAILRTLEMAAREAP